VHTNEIVEQIGIALRPARGVKNCEYWRATPGKRRAKIMVNLLPGSLRCRAAWILIRSLTPVPV